ncbi:Brix-domain-containing protein [Meira miltonrushii]|uniref:Ribosome production factor 2 homolog n=1 Tax=Meira miltonrushii TaxID=1280837 RepID=A0A316VBF6_9BASI|nr:Brix-domain-containing protein [Meira miltonrushii]PWN33563.1 Brix-domain-containing protein [Meira miltonrushii]
MIRIARPRNARSKRALEKRDAKEYENAKTALFVRGPHSSDKVALALREFSLLKKPHSIPFNKKNDVVPFEDSASLEFWGKKNDASLFLLANHQKKRPHNLTWARLFDGNVLDMYEMGIISAKGHEDFKAKHSPSVGARPMFHFSGPHFAADGDVNSSAAAMSVSTPGVSQSFQHIKSLFLDFYRGEEMAPGSGPGSNPGQAGMQVALKGGLQHIISITEAPFDGEEVNGSATKSSTVDDLADLYKMGAQKEQSSSSALIDTSANGRMIHLRVYAVIPTSSNTTDKPTQDLPVTASTPASSLANVRLEEIGPSFDLVLRRRQMPSMDKLQASLRRPKTQAQKTRQGKGTKKNIETDDMGDTVGRVHVGKQDLSKLQTRKMKGLKRNRTDQTNDDDNMVSDDGEELEFESAEDEDEDSGKRQRK